jgi:hypothetical protein
VTAAASIPLVALAHHEAPSSWTAGERRELSAELAARGTTITELSDLRELLGLPRLSEVDSWEREEAPEILDTERGQAALARVRHLRALLLEDLEATSGRVVRIARELLDLGPPARLRLGELSALWAQARIVGIVLDVAGGAQ